MTRTGAVLSCCLTLCGISSLAQADFLFACPPQTLTLKPHASSAKLFRIGGATRQQSRTNFMMSSSVEERYNRAIEESDGQDVDALCGYACYLQTVKAEYERASELYKKALIVDTDRARRISIELWADVESRSGGGTAVIRKDGIYQGTTKFSVPRLVVPKIILPGKIRIKNE